MRRATLRIAILVGILGAGGIVLARHHFDGSVGAAQELWTPPGGRAAFTAPAPREPCARRAPLRQAFFGDLHVHTAYSHDAAALGGTLVPDAAYRFARGEGVHLASLDKTGRTTQEVRIDRPLDFAAVTDHAEWLGETAVCNARGAPSYEAWICRAYRGESWAGPLGKLLFQLEIRGRARRSRAICGEHAQDCRVAALDRWRSTQEAAERWYDRSEDCAFTTFHAYEHSRRRRGFMLHRNVIFRNEIVPELPISWVEAPTLEDFWRLLDERCLKTGGACDAVSIPHNSNYSSGLAFQVGYRDAPLAQQRERAATRANHEPLMEIVQAKGESECRRGLASVVGAPDEACDFEKTFAIDGAELEACAPGAEPDERCWSALSYGRYALSEGLYEAQRIGVNPLRLGFIGSTDTHNGTPGAVSEELYFGTSGVASASPGQRLSSERAYGQPAAVARNPGGLAGIWADENSRDALFEAMQRREVFATSGPRIRPRFFGGWSLGRDLCQRVDLVAAGYADGVPMGGELPPRPPGPGAQDGGAAPVFAVRALADPGTEASPGHALQRLQIVKVWNEGAGRYGQRVFDVAGSDPGDGADLETCQPVKRGRAELCAVWSDPDFDPGRGAAYYARVLEVPSCRWSWRQCRGLPEAERPKACSDPEIPRSVQERAWTSPIWYSPAGGSDTQPEPSESS